MQGQATDNTDNECFDIFIIGGGVNGFGIARDAIGRGYSVALAEKSDVGSATSSSSTKLLHGGLRYLEFFAFRLVHEALVEREVLLQSMPHISWPMRFVLPLDPDMRFVAGTPTSRLLQCCMPWMKGRRPAWVIRLGLWLYDYMGGRKILPPSKSVHLHHDIAGMPLNKRFVRAFEYSDCWVEDARLTLLNAIDARERGANIMVQTRVDKAIPQTDGWQIYTRNQHGQVRVYKARMLVNATGPWVGQTIQHTLQLPKKDSVRLVRGSHIVTKKLFDHGKSYFLQGADGRIMFAIPYEEDYTLIGTTDTDHNDVQQQPICSEEEKSYMLNFINHYFERQLTQSDIVWSFSGVRPLYDDGTKSATAATRDYALRLHWAKYNQSISQPVLHIFGGKITTYRKLAESALSHIDTILGKRTLPWTSQQFLPGGAIALNNIAELQQNLAKQLPFLDAFTIRRLVRQYGSQVSVIFAGVDAIDQLGTNFGQGIFAKEIDWAIEHEWVCCAEDFLWRRSKMGLRFVDGVHPELDTYIKQRIVYNHQQL